MLRLTLLYGFDSEGGFYAGDKQSGIVGYAYPTSTYARQAKKKALTTAIELIQGETIEWHVFGESIPKVKQQQVILWKKLNELQDVTTVEV